MKKTISILAAVMLVLSFAGFAAAADLPAIHCAGDAGTIDAIDCDVPDEQSGWDCDTFDFEDLDDYSGDDKQPNRAMFPICDCIPSPFESVQSGQTYYLGMEILVDRNDGAGIVDGDNGVYWAENIQSIDVQTYDNEGEACEWDVDNGYTGEYISEGSFGNFVYYDEDNDIGFPDDCEDLDDNDVVKFDTSLIDGAGYEVTLEDDQFNASNWVIDIPEMWADFPVAQPGWIVYAKVCITPSGQQSGGGICGECEKCCFTIKIGTLCEPSSGSCADLLVFPYIPNPAGSFWFGMVVTNMSSTAGTATVTLYEKDGDVASGEIDLPANVPTVIDISSLALTTSVEGTLGNAQCWAKVVAYVPASGFGFMANNTTYASMGYLAEKECNSCSRCGTWAKDLGFICPNDN